MRAFKDLTIDERIKLAKEDPNTFSLIANEAIEEAILSSDPHSQLKMRATLARLNRETRNYSDPIDRASHVFGAMHESFLELNAHLQSFTNMVGDE